MFVAAIILPVGFLFLSSVLCTAGAMPQSASRNLQKCGPPANPCKWQKRQGHGYYLIFVLTALASVTDVSKSLMFQYEENSEDNFWKRIWIYSTQMRHSGIKSLKLEMVPAWYHSSSLVLSIHVWTPSISLSISSLLYLGMALQTRHHTDCNIGTGSWLS